MNCNTGTDIPILEIDPCDGKFYNTACVIHPTALTYLNLPANSSVFTIINTFILALQFKDETIAALEARIEALEP
jgi:hypothetical protein